MLLGKYKVTNKYVNNRDVEQWIENCLGETETNQNISWWIEKKQKSKCKTNQIWWIEVCVDRIALIKQINLNKEKILKIGIQ